MLIGMANKKPKSVSGKQEMLENYINNFI